MPNSLINRRVVLNSNYVFTDQALSYFSFCTTQPSFLQKVIYDKYLFRPLISAGIFTLLDRLWVPACEIEQNGTISLVNPSATAITLVNTPTWTQYQGWDFDGATQYANTNWAPSTGVNYTLNSASIFAYLRENTQSSVDIGASNAGSTNNVSIWARFTDNRFYEACNDTGSASFVSNTNSSGLVSLQRTASNNTNIIRNGVTLSSETDASTGRATVSVYAGALNSNGAAAAFSNRQSSVFGVGSSGFSHLTLYNIIQAYMTQLGTNV